MAVLLPEGKQSYTNNAGVPLAGGRVYTYDAGTNTPRQTFAEAAGTTPLANPVILDARGEATIFWSGSYKVVLRDASDVIVWTVDNVSGFDVSVSALVADLASTNNAAKGAGQLGFGYALAYTAGTVGAALQDSYVNVMWFLSETQRADVKARTLANDLTTQMQAAHTWANGRPVYYPRGAYKFTSLTLAKAGDGIVGDGSGGTVGEDGTLLVSGVSGTTAAITLTTSVAHNVLFSDFTLKQSGGVQGRGIVMADCYWLRTENLRVKGFTDNLYASKALYHHHKRLFSELSTNGVNYWGAAGTWNTDWFNNVITFDTCRFSDCTVTGVSVKGAEVVFINPDFSNMSTVGAIGAKVYGESTSFKAHGIKFITPYIESTKIAFGFTYAKVEIDGDGYVQGGANVGAQAKSIIDADNSTVLWSRIEDKDYFEFGYRLTNSSTLTMRSGFSGSIRAGNSADATSKFLVDDYDEGVWVATLTGCSTSPTANVSYVRQGKTVTLQIPDLRATSNTTACTLTGMPANLQPTTEQFTYCNVMDNGVEIRGVARIFSAGTIGLQNGAIGTVFTNSGNKGSRPTSISFTLQ